LNTDVQVVIRQHPSDTVQASVIAPNLSKLWHKLYPSKDECVAGLGRLGLLTIIELADALKSGSDSKESIILAQTSVDTEWMVKSGFVETSQASTS